MDGLSPHGRVAAAPVPDGFRFVTDFIMHPELEAYLQQNRATGPPMRGCHCRHESCIGARRHASDDDQFGSRPRAATTGGRRQRASCACHRSDGFAYTVRERLRPKFLNSADAIVECNPLYGGGTACVLRRHYASLTRQVRLFLAAVAQVPVQPAVWEPSHPEGPHVPAPALFYGTRAWLGRAHVARYALTLHGKIINRADANPVCVNHELSSCTDLEPGTFVAEYLGELITSAEADRRGTLTPKAQIMQKSAYASKRLCVSWLRHAFT